MTMKLLFFFGVLIVISVFCQNKISNKQIQFAMTAIDTTQLIHKISPNERDEEVLFYAEKALEGKDIYEVMYNSQKEMLAFIESIPEKKMSYQYNMSKWSVAEVLQHVIFYEEITQERIKIAIGKSPKMLQFQYYNQTTTAKVGKGKSKAEMLKCFTETRQKTIDLFASLSENELLMIGSQDGFKMPTRVMGLCASGHQQHHFNVLKAKYKL